MSAGDLNEQEPGRPVSPRKTLEDDCEALMAELRAMAHKIQKHGQQITMHDYTDGITAGKSIIEFVEACGKLANAFDDIVGSVQECEMKKAFMSGIVAASMAWIGAVDKLPDEVVADLPYRYMDDFEKFIGRQVLMHGVSTQNKTGN